MILLPSRGLRRISFIRRCRPRLLYRRGFGYAGANYARAAPRRCGHALLARSHRCFLDHETQQTPHGDDWLHSVGEAVTPGATRTYAPALECYLSCLAR